MEKTSPSLASAEASGRKLPRPLFVYGTLRAKPLLAWLLLGDARRVPEVEHMVRPAQVTKYTRFAVKHADYPAVVGSESEADCVDGYLLQVETSSHRKKLDDYEGEEYVAETTMVQLMDGNNRPTGEVVEAEMYVWSADRDMLTGEPWELGDFMKEKLEDWLDYFGGIKMVGEDK